MQAVFACNQYVDEQAPWALRKTDPERMERVLATLCGCIRDLAVACLRGDADRFDQAARRDGHPRGRARSRRAGRRSRAWRPIRVRQSDRRCFPRLEMPRRSRVMLIDSHCHLQYKGLVEDQQGVLAARPRGRRRRISQHLDPPERMGPGRRHRRARSPTSGPASASIRTRPTRTPTWARARCSTRPNAPKVIAIGETGLDYYYDHSDRATQQALFRTHIAVARDDRPAADRPHPRRGGRHRSRSSPRRWRRGPSRR